MRTTPTLFYALASEGMGHATRAVPVIEALRARGYRVEVFCGGRVAAYLRQRIGAVNELFFVPLHYVDNELDIWRSFGAAVARLGPCLMQAWALFWRMVRERPVAVISDFEFMSAWMGWWSGTPVIALDNMHLLTHGHMPQPQTKRERAEKRAIARVVRWCQPVVDRTLITCFWHPGLGPAIDAAAVRFVPCAVRAEVLARRSSASSHGRVLVYQTSTTNLDLPLTLARAAAEGGLRFVVYGAGRVGIAGPIEYRGFSEQGFLDDLAAAPFVIVNGGHSTIVEALALAKPVLSEPVRRQYEQQANALGLGVLGVGRGVERLSAAAILDFVRDLPAMRARAELVSGVVDNAAVVDAVEHALRELDPSRALAPAGDAASRAVGLGRRPAVALSASGVA